jgi:hypothetical protein
VREKEIFEFPIFDDEVVLDFNPFSVHKGGKK